MKKYLFALMLCMISVFAQGNEVLNFYTGGFAPYVKAGEKSYPILMYYVDPSPRSPIVKEINLVGNNKGYITLLDDEHPHREVTYNFVLNEIIYIYVYAGQAYMTAEPDHISSWYPDMVKKVFKITFIGNNRLTMTLQP